MPSPVPCPPVTQRCHGSVVARGARAPAPSSGGQSAVSPMLPWAHSASSHPQCPPSPETRLCPPCVPQPRAVPPPCAVTCAVTVAVCHGRLVPPALPGDSPSTIRPCPGPAQAVLCLADTKGLRGEGGAGRGLGAASFPHDGLGQLCPSLRSCRGSCCPRPLSRAPRECWGAPGGAALTPLLWQSSARSRWSRSALQGPPPTGRPRRAPESPRRSRVASPSPALACCRSPSADVSAAPSWAPCPALPVPGSLPVPEVPCFVPGMSACPQHPGFAPGFSARPHSSDTLWGLPFPSLGAPDTPRVPCYPQPAMASPQAPHSPSSLGPEHQTPASPSGTAVGPQPVPGARRAPEQRVLAGGALRPAGPDGADGYVGPGAGRGLR